MRLQRVLGELLLLRRQFQYPLLHGRRGDHLGQARTGRAKRLASDIGRLQQAVFVPWHCHDLVLPGAVIPNTLGNFLLPLMIGVRRRFPRLNLFSWYLTIAAGTLTVYVLSPAASTRGGPFTPLIPRCFRTATFSPPQRACLWSASPASPPTDAGPFPPYYLISVQVTQTVAAGPPVNVVPSGPVGTFANGWGMPSQVMADYFNAFWGSPDSAPVYNVVTTVTPYNWVQLTP